MLTLLLSLILVVSSVAAAHAADIITGLMGYWRFDEGTGTSIADSSGRNHPATFVNTPTWSLTIRKVGPASLQFVTASATRVSIANHADLSPTTGWTTTAWINPTTIANASLTWKAASVAGQIFHRMQLRVSTGFVRCGFADTDAETTTSVVAGAWTHVACTWDGATIRSYVNGVQEGTAAVAAALAPGALDMFIGARDDAQQFYDGRLDEVRLYNRALTQQDIVATMHYPLRALPLSIP